MATTQPQTDNIKLAYSATLAAAWLVTLAVSALPDALCMQFLGTVPGWVISLKILILAGILLSTWAWRSLAALRGYLILLTLNAAAWWALPVIRNMRMWADWEGGAAWITGMMGIQVLKGGIALLTLAALWLLYRRRAAFFLVRGKLDAAAAPVRWLGIGQGASWKALGPIIAAAAAAVMLLVLILTSRPPLESPAAVAAGIAAALLLSATNALSEETSYRSALLAPLEPAVGKDSAMGITAVYFGLAHLSGGVPLAALPTVLMTGLLGWLMAKSMLETRGFAWAWFIHFVNDIPVFLFLALGAGVLSG